MTPLQLGVAGLTILLCGVVLIATLYGLVTAASLADAALVFVLGNFAFGAVIVGYVSLFDVPSRRAHP